MYNPKHFAGTNLSDTIADIRAFGIGELITYGSTGIETSIVPLLVNDDATLLTGHLARANQQWRTIDLAVPVLVTWRGPDAYVSPSYYPTKQETGKVVPTWNYTTIQARGVLSVHDDREWVEQFVRSLTNHHESRLPAPWSVDDAPREYLDSMLKAIIGISIRVDSIDAKNKLSQNRSNEDVAGVINGLENGIVDDHIATRMRQTNKVLSKVAQPSVAN